MRSPENRKGCVFGAEMSQSPVTKMIQRGEYAHGFLHVQLEGDKLYVCM
jgi:hypothetical protein